MKNILKFKKQIISISTIFSLFLPYVSIFAAQASSTNFIVDSTYFDTGKNSNSANFGLTGDIVTGNRGVFVSSNLPLVPGLITSCGKITTSGTYILANSLIGISGTCFSIQANNVTIDGGGFLISASAGNTSYAIVATSSAVAGNAYGTTTIQNINFSGFLNGFNASGNNAVSGNTNGGNAGNIVISSSTLTTILASGGLGAGTGVRGNGSNIVINNSTTGNITTVGTGGNIILNSSGNLNISNNTYTATNILSLNYVSSLTTSNTTLSALQSFIINGNNYGPFVGGGFPIIPGNISSCGNLYFAGTYIFTQNISSTCNVLGSGVILNGNGFALNANLTANNYGATISDLDISGNVSTTGAGAGALIFNNASNVSGNTTVTGPIQGDGTSSLGNTTISSGGSVATSSVSFVSDVVNNGIINSGVSVIGKITNNSIINSLTGSFNFNASSTNAGTVNGNAIFNASSTNAGTVNGNARFNYFTASSGSVNIATGTAFIGTGFVSGNVYDSTGVNTINTWIFNASSTNTGVLKGNAIFNSDSKNIITGTVQGNATFKDMSLNLGSVTGNSDVYSPVVRPLGGTTNGQVIYHDYAGMYFNDQAVGHGVVGKWNDINNWWLDVNSTVHSPVLPTAGDTTIVLFGNISTTTASAYVKSIIFQGTTTNNINIQVDSTELDAALFNASSTNGVNGIITGNATFSGIGTQNLGTVTGYITRRYDGGIFNVIEDFTHNGIYWIIQAVNGATVDLTNATYSLANNIFQALNNATFIWNNIIGVGAPNITVTSPVSGNNIKWKPIISWGNSTLCQYKIDGGNYTSVNCANNGSDIPRPSAGLHTLFIRGSIGLNTTEQSIIFTYDNTQPVDTDCSTPLDEVTRPYYYLTANVNTCNITATTTLRGDNNGGGNFYSAVNVVGNGKSVTLQNMNISGALYGFGNMTVSSTTVSGFTTIDKTFSADSLSTFATTTVSSLGIVNSGRFISDVTNSGTINNSTGDVTVSGSMINNNIISGDFVLNKSSINNGTISGNVVLNDNSINQGNISGNAIYNMYTAEAGIVTISSSTNFQGTGNISGNILDNRGENIFIWNFEDTSSNTGTIKGNTYFNDLSSNLGTINGDAYFSDYATNQGTVLGNARRYLAYLTAHQLGGNVSGLTTYYSYPNSVVFRNISGDNNWSNMANWFRFVATTTPLGRLPVSGENVTLFASTTLVNNVNANIYIAVASTTIDGARYTVNGNISGNGAYGGYDALDFDLRNINVTGTTTAIGGDGNPNVDGGKGGHIRVYDSSTYVISVNGGDPIHNGGDAGTIYVYNTIATQPNTPIMAIGGDSVGCGFGGSGGNVTLVDTSDYVLLVDAGKSATSTVAEGGNCLTAPVGFPGTAGQISVTGSYNGSNNAAVNNVQTRSNYSKGSGTDNKIIRNENRGIIPVVNFAIKLSNFALPKLPVFGNGQNGTFSFGAGLKTFFNISLPYYVVKNFINTPNLLTSIGINSFNDWMVLRYKNKDLDNTKITGLFTVYSNKFTQPIKSSVSVNNKSQLVQNVKINAGEEVIVTLMSPKGSNYKGKFNNQDINFVNNRVNILIPNKSGNYLLTTLNTPVILNISVTEDNQFSHTVEGVSNVFIKVIKFIKNIFKIK